MINREPHRIQSPAPSVYSEGDAIDTQALTREQEPQTLSREVHSWLSVCLDREVDRGGKRLPRRYRHRTPAMAAGLTSRCWRVSEVLTLPLPSAPIGAG